MEWKKFSESKVELPDEIIEKLADGFSDATNGLVSIVVNEIALDSKLRGSVLQTKFQFSLYLVSEFLDNFSYRILMFGYDINLYPVTVRINADILSDLNLKDPFILKHDSYDQESFTKLIKSIFETNSFENTVTGIMKIANRNKLPY
ncbi:hypothetical protein [Sphingobacterium sp. MYb388]|uniref:hypothetical protein n=1 Tax=Sphingobacterium sp. MYb388 TaxID=2745437 RepID=UPI0030A3CB96